MFVDRKEAAKLLAEALQPYKNSKAIILALPRGGVVIGAYVAQALNLTLDIIVIRKIGHPLSPEYAIGAVDANGMTLFDEDQTRYVDPEWLESEVRREMEEAKRRRQLYRGEKPDIPLTNKTVIVVDDGIATGLTMRLAVLNIKKERPLKIIVAVPVAPLEIVAVLRREGADEVIVLEPPSMFMGSVGAHYQNFEQVSDDEVIAYLRASQRSQ